MGVKCGSTFSPIATKSYHLHFEAWICMEKFEVKINTNGKNIHDAFYSIKHGDFEGKKSKQKRVTFIYCFKERTLVNMWYLHLFCVRFHEY